MFKRRVTNPGRPPRAARKAQSPRRWGLRTRFNYVHEIESARDSAAAGELAQAREHFELALGIVRKLNRPRDIVDTLIEYATCLVMNDEARLAAGTVDEAAMIAIAGGLPIDDYKFAMVSAQVARANEDLDVAAQHYKVAAQRFVEERRYGRPLEALSGFAFAVTSAGTPSEVLEAIDVAIAALESDPTRYASRLACHLADRARILQKLASSSRAESLDATRSFLSDAEQAWKEAADLFVKCADLTLAAKCTLERSEVLWGLGELQLARVVVGQARSLCDEAIAEPVDPADRDMATAIRDRADSLIEVFDDPGREVVESALMEARSLDGEGRVDLARFEHERAIALAREASNPAVLVGALLEYSDFLAFEGFAGEAQDRLNAATDVAEDSGVPLDEDIVRLTRGNILRAQGRHVEAAEHFRGEAQRLRASGRGVEEARALANYAFALYRADSELEVHGDGSVPALRAAVVAFEGSRDELDSVDEVNLALCYSRLGFLLRESDELEEASRVLRQARDLWEQTRDSWNGTHEASVLAKVELFLGASEEQRGNRDAASESFFRAAGIYGEIGREDMQAEALHQLERVEDEKGWSFE